jgi:hypothetical protein
MTMTAPISPEAPHIHCRICSQLGDSEYGFQKNGWPDNDSHLPGAAYSLNVVRDFKPYSDRKLQLRQCPDCQTYYLYTTDYEFLAGGSEDEQFLTRLTAAQAAEYLQRPAPE